MRLPGNVACRDAGNGIAGAAAKHSVTVCGTSGCPVFPDEPAATPSLNRRDKAGSHAKCRSALGVSTKGRTRTAGTLNKVHWPHKQKRHCLSSAHPRTASFLLGLVHPATDRTVGLQNRPATTVSSGLSTSPLWIQGGRWDYVYTVCSYCQGKKTQNPVNRPGMRRRCSTATPTKAADTGSPGRAG